MINKPHIVFITTHDLGKHLGCYGQSTVSSDAVDSLAASGVRFDKSFCTSPLCSPSRSALHTGRFSHANGIMGLTHANFGWEYHEGEEHMAAKLQRDGYTTALVGVQHVSREPARLGYDVLVETGPARRMGEEGARILKEQTSGDKPLYLEVGFFEPHRPFNWEGAVPDESKGVAIPPYLPDCPESRQDVAALQGIIKQMDEGVAIILDSLKELGIVENTWVIFTTDHGIAMPRAKSTLYDPGIETALLMRWPAAGLDGGRVYEELISNVDIVPTMLEALGMDQPDNLHGHSFWPLLRGEEYQPQACIYSEKTYHTQYEPIRSIRTKQHKLVVNFEVSTKIDVPGDIRQSPIYPVMLKETLKGRPQVELYDLDQDQLEMLNLAEHPELKEVRQGLLNQLREWMELTGDPLLHGPIPSPYYGKAIRALFQL
ncbi:sulfatase family protein [Paenibacillus sp. strain BS8-2]